MIFKNIDYKAHIPGIYSSNLHGKGYSKITAEAIKGEYNKGFNTTVGDRYLTSNKKSFHLEIKTDNTKKNELRPCSTDQTVHTM